MTQPQTKRKTLYALSVIPFFDCIVDQLNNAYKIHFGPLSLLQIAHGSLIVLYLALCATAVFRTPSRLARIPLPALGALLFLAIISTKELVLKGTLSMASLGPYGQMSYWVLFWITISLLCERREDTDIILRGLAIGALATAASVFLGLVFGAPNFYSEAEISSSAGWFDTGKMVTGVLNTGAIVILYLGRRRNGWLAPVLSCTCFAACIVTYARAGSVALVAMLLWLPFWTILLARGRQRLWTVRLLALILLAAVLVPVAVDTGKIFARWGDVKQGGEAGSGRATFWKIALDGYLEATPAQQALGRGYSAMADLLLREYGMDIKHTHNDMLDMLTVGGLTGALWLLFFIATLFSRVLRSSLRSIEGAAGLAILLNYLFHSQFTGQIWGTDAMSYYAIALACLFVNDRADKSDRAVHKFPLPSREAEAVLA